MFDTTEMGQVYHFRKFYWTILTHSGGSQLGWFLARGDLARKHLVMSGNSFGCYNRGGSCYWHLVGRGQDIAIHPTIHGMLP